MHAPRGRSHEPRGTILVVEDDRPLQDALVTTLEAAGFNVLAAADGGEALKVLGATAVDLIVSDVRDAARRRPRAAAPLAAARSRAARAADDGVRHDRPGRRRDARRRGRLSRQAVRGRGARATRRALRARGAVRRRGAGVRCPSRRTRASRKLLELAARVAQSDVTVLLHGRERHGQGSARALHPRAARSAAPGPFVAVNCAAIPEQMLEALLFGHEKGAFTGAQARSIGKFVQANGGTLLLDEVTEMDLGLQAKLLRVLQEREVEPLGASKPVALDVRVLATSNRDLEQAVRDGAFREDLYYRLSVFPLRIAPLRERPGDIARARRRASSQRALGAAALAVRRPRSRSSGLRVARQRARARERGATRAALGRRRAAHRARSTSCSTTSRARSRAPCRRRDVPAPSPVSRASCGKRRRGASCGARNASRRAPAGRRAARHQRSHAALQAVEDARRRHSSAGRSRALTRGARDERRSR